MSESHYLYKEPCPSCGSRDNLARYSDGHAHCFGCGYYEPADGGEATTKPRSNMSRQMDTLIEGTAQALRARKITQETSEKWSYLVGSENGTPVQIAQYRDANGQVVAQKLRDAEKNMKVLGDLKAATPLYGQWLWKEGGNMVVVTEGEIDALTVSQVFGNKWPVVSVKNGAQGAAKNVREAIDFLTKFDRVVFMFDMDEPGRKAAVECANLLPPGKAHIASLPLKDPNDMLVKGKGGDISQAAWNAKAHRPDGIVSVGDIREEALKPPEMGAGFFLPELTNALFGIHLGQVITLGAGTGVGKTDFLAQQIAYQVIEEDRGVGTIFLETPPPELLQIIAGKVMGKTFHIPDGSWTEEELNEGIDRLEKGKLKLYDSFGALDWETVKATIIYMIVAEGLQYIYLDHLTALAALVDDEKKALEMIMAELASIAQQYNASIIIVSHLTTPEGKSHEEGGRVTIRQFKGSRAIGFWSHVMLGLERDQQAEDEDERCVTTLRVLKARRVGRATGKTFRLRYDEATGLLALDENNPFTASLGTSTGEDDF